MVVCEVSPIDIQRCNTAPQLLSEPLHFNALLGDWTLQETVLQEASYATDFLGVNLISKEVKYIFGNISFFLCLSLWNRSVC